MAAKGYTAYFKIEGYPASGRPVYPTRNMQGSWIFDDFDSAEKMVIKVASATQKPCNCRIYNHETGTKIRVFKVNSGKIDK